MKADGSRRAEGSGGIARERLKLMASSAPLDCSPEMAAHMKKEIGDILSRYLKLSDENVEIRVVLKQNTEKSIRC